jgi:hypothetical protein
VFVWRVAGGYPPYCTCRKANQSAEPERCAPSVVSDEPRKQRRGESAAGANTGEDETVNETTFLYRDPAGDELVRRRIDNRLTRSEGEPDRDQQRDGVRNARRQQCRQSGSDSPPQNPDGKDASRSEARSKPSCRKLKTSVSDQESAEDPP